jgi:transcription termination/antitermination protein NusG
VNGQAVVMERCQPAVEHAGPLGQACWYAVRTRSRHEKLVAKQLENQGIESFLPVVTQTHNWSDRRKQIETPLFSGYAFLRMVHSPDDRVRVLRTQGVVSFVGVQGSGTPIPDHEIEDIKTLVASRISYDERPFLRVGQRVRVRGGALDGIQGILVAENGDRSLVISVEPIQRSLYVRVAGYEVEAV